MNTEQQEKSEPLLFENEHLKVHMLRQPGCTVALDIEITPKAAEGAYQRAIKAINKEVSLPGFRKGKAPQQILLQHYSSHIDREWKEILVHTAFQETVKLINVYPLSRETIQKPDLKSASRERGAKLLITFEAHPEIPEIHPEEIALKKVEKRQLTEKEIENSLEEIRWQHASWEEITDRPLQEGDCVDVDVEDVDRPGHFICQNTRFEAIKGKMGDWMLDLILGKHVLESVEGMSERPKEMPSEKEFQPTRCKITIKGIKVAHLPELNDELAKKVGVDSLEKLKEKVVKNLEKQIEEDVQEVLRVQIENFLAEHYSFDIPASLTQRECKNRLDYILRELHKSGKSSQEVAQQTESLKAKLEKEVKQAFQLFFLSRKIAEKHHISVSRNELVQELMMQMYTNASPIDTSMDPEEARSKIYVNLLLKKVKDFLIDRAKVE